MARKTTDVTPISSRRNFGSIHAPLCQRVPPTPRGLSKRAKEIWRVSAKDLFARGLLSPLYLSQLRVYCYILAECEALPVDVPPELTMTAKKWEAFTRGQWREARAQARAMMLPLPIPPERRR